VFGYGSLIWRPDFPFTERQTANLDGYARRFWQGSHDHRGVPDAPGRVVTLVESSNARCTGVAYLIEHAVFDHLDHREKNGYERAAVTLQFAAGEVDAVVYIATPDNVAFLGPAPLPNIAHQIVASSGPSGTNLDYLLRLAASLRDLDAFDAHVFELETLVKQLTDKHAHPLLR
jgi:cation transport regulator ChaC